MNNNKYKRFIHDYEYNNNIIDFIINSNYKKLKNNLINLIYNSKYCKKILGEGKIGIVYEPNINKYEKIKINNKKIKIPIVIKKSKYTDDVNIELIDNIIYIYTYRNLTVETIIHIYINKLWYNKVTPHIQLMINYSCCNNNYVNKIISEKNGLNELIDISLYGFNPLTLLFPNYKSNASYSSYLNTLYDLLHYIFFCDNNGKIKLPNNQICDICELYDYISISFIHTYNSLIKNKVYVFDLHFNNIFIHWLNKYSYFGDTNISNIENIIYKVNNKIYKIKTFGFIIKIGDYGTTILKPNENIIILGQANNIKDNINIINTLINSNYGISQFINNTKSLPLKYLKNIVLYDLLNKYPYNTLTFFTYTYNLNISILKNFLNPVEILEYFTKYEIKEIIKNDKTLIINEY
jgi:hypothetical protein